MDDGARKLIDALREVASMDPGEGEWIELPFTPTDAREALRKMGEDTDAAASDVGLDVSPSVDRIAHHAAGTLISQLYGSSTDEPEVSVGEALEVARQHMLGVIAQARQLERDDRAP